MVLVFVRTMSGKTLSLDLDLASKVHSVKEVIAQIEGIPTSTQRLIFGGQLMQDTASLSIRAFVLF
jgi:hypothetical protein